MAFMFKYGVTVFLTLTSLTTAAQVGIGTTTPNSTLEINGSLSLPIRTGSAPTTLSDADYTYLVNSNTINGADITLPSASGIAGRVYIIRNIGSRRQEIIAIGGQTIDGNPSVRLNSGDSVTIQSDGSSWWIVGAN